MLTYKNENNRSRPTSSASQASKATAKAQTIQPKLNIGKPNDRYEQEADRVADKVVNQPASTGPAIQKSEEEEVQAMPISKIQRMNKEEDIQTKPMNIQRMGEEEEVQAKPNTLVQREPKEELQAKANVGGQTASPEVSAGIDSTKGGGSPLSSPIRKQMESGIGANFGNVRIHTGSRAENLSNELNAQAFTVGNDVYFNKGKYNPESQSGKHLLAHELTHVVQQNGGLNRQIQKQDKDMKLEPQLGRNTEPALPTLSVSLTLAGFETGKAALKPEHVTALKDQLVFFRSYLSSSVHAELRVIGHADAIGNEPNNQQLSENRARSVAKALTELQISPGQISTQGLGESQLRVKTKQAEAQNRRVEILPGKQKFDFGLSSKALEKETEPQIDWRTLLPRITAELSEEDKKLMTLQILKQVGELKEVNEFSLGKLKENGADLIFGTFGIDDPSDQISIIETIYESALGGGKIELRYRGEFE